MVQIGFYFSSSGGFAAAPGWYIDDVSVETGAMAWNSPEGFEGHGTGTIGDWSVEDGVWQIGVPNPNFGGGPSAHFGTNCAGTILGGDYPAGHSARPVGQTFTLQSLSENVWRLQWDWQCFGSQASGQLQI